MAFTMPDFRKRSPEEVSPMGNLIQNFMKNYQAGVDTRFKLPNAQEELQKAIQYNKWYGPDMQSQIGLRGAQAGHLGALTTGQNIENKYKEPSLQQQIELNKLKMATATQKQELFRRAMEKAYPPNNTMTNEPIKTDQPQYQPNHGMGMLSNIQQLMGGEQPQNMRNPQQQNQQQPNIDQQQQNNQPILSYSEAAMLSKQLGLTAPKIIDVNGQKIAVTPFGNIPVAKGETTLEKNLAKNDAKHISDLENIVETSIPKQEAINQVVETISSPEFEQMRQNPALGQHELGWFSKFGTPEQQRLIGNFRSNTGDIIKSAAADFKGQFRIGEQSLLNSMKMNESDSLDVMKGKAEALKYMVDNLSKRAELEADAMRNKKMSPIAAKIYSDKMIDSRDLKEKIHSMLYPKILSPKKLEQAKLELARRRG